MIVEGINNSPLENSTKSKAIEQVRSRSADLTKMFDSLRFKAPSAHKTWYQHITTQTIMIISPILEADRVSSLNGTNTWAYIYAKIAGEDPAKYMETAQ